VTNNQNGTSGYGDSNSTRNTINVETGASVTGTNVGITGNGFAFGSFSEANTVNNFGVISGATGIIGQSGILNNKLGATVSGTSGAGFEILSQGTVANAGTISGTTQGVDIQNGTVTNTSTGTISGGVEGVTIRDDGLQSGGNPSVNNDGSITGGTTGVRFRSTSDFGELTNSGSITATGANGFGVSFDGSGTVTNSGTIVSAAANTRAINATGDVNVTNNSGGTITGRVAGVQAGGAVNVSNAQGALIEATEPTFVAAAILATGSAAFVQNSGTIRALGGSATGILAVGGVTVNNTGTGVITATRQAIASNGAVTVTGNEGLIETNSSQSIAIFGGTNVSVSNGAGTIRAIGGSSAAILAGENATVTNAGGLIQTTGQDSSSIVATNVQITGNTGTIEATGANGIAVRALDTADVTNSGTIQALGINGVAVDAVTANIRNAGTIEATNANGIAVRALDMADVTNSGTIQALGGGSAISANIARVENAGLIKSAALGIQANEATVTNFENGGIGSGIAGISATTANVDNRGTITGSVAGISGGAVNLTNAATGQIVAFGNGGVALDAQTVNVRNAGTIAGTIGIRAVNASTITNSGTIEGTGGSAIKFGPQADTLTLLPGSKIIGVVDMGFGADTVNVGANAVTITSRVSSFFKAAPVEIPVLINFTGTLNANGTVNNPNSIPFVQADGAVASLDPTTFGQADRALMNFTSGVSSLVQGRLGGRAANGSAVQVVSFAPTGASGRTEEAFAAISAMGYAKVRIGPHAHPLTYADAPYNVWTAASVASACRRATTPCCAPSPLPAPP
jgi:hypothetical protein